MTPPLFSIVTITYENVEGLRKTVASVGRQSFGDLEHIVVDGGSADGTADWLHERFSGCWVSEPDGGRYHAMNKGARMARGDYLWFLHAGDAFGGDDSLWRAASAAHDHPEWLYGLARVVDPDDTIRGMLGFMPFNMFTFAILGHPLPHQATAIQRTLFWELGGYDEDSPIAADQLLLLRAARHAPPRVVPDFLCNFDATGVSGDRSWWANYRDAERNRRKLGAPVTRSRLLDESVAFGYAAVRNSARTVLRRCGAQHPSRRADDRESPR